MEDLAAAVLWIVVGLFLFFTSFIWGPFYLIARRKALAEAFKRFGELIIKGDL